MNIEKSKLWDQTTPFTDSERAWLTKMLKKETRTQAEWDVIIGFLHTKTIFSLMPQGGKRFHKYSKEGILLEPVQRTLFAGTNLKELEKLQAYVFKNANEPDNFVVTMMSFEAATEVANREKLYLMLDRFTSGCIRFISYSGQNERINATMALDPNSEDFEAQILTALKNGGGFA